MVGRLLFGRLLVGWSVGRSAYSDGQLVGWLLAFGRSVVSVWSVGRSVVSVQSVGWVFGFRCVVIPRRSVSWLLAFGRSVVSVRLVSRSFVSNQLVSC